MRRLKFNLLLITFISITIGCFSNSRTIVNKNGNDTINAKNIAILPIESKDSESKAAKLLRSRLFEEIYFKGYSKIPLEEMDTKLKSLLENSEKDVTATISPGALKDAVGADAGMYCSMTENYKTRLFYSPVKITVICELRSTDNGKIIWNAKSESTRRNFDFTDKRLKKKLTEDFESLIDEVVDEIIKTLPDGPSLSS